MSSRVMWPRSACARRGLASAACSPQPLVTFGRQRPAPPAHGLRADLLRRHAQLAGRVPVGVAHVEQPLRPSQSVQRWPAHRGTGRTAVGSRPSLRVRQCLSGDRPPEQLGCRAVLALITATDTCVSGANSTSSSSPAMSSAGLVYTPGPAARPLPGSTAGRRPRPERWCPVSSSLSVRPRAGRRVLLAQP